MSTMKFSLGDQIHTTHIEWLGKEISQDFSHSGPPKRLTANLNPRIWADEPRWTSFHAACWHALRNDKWTNLPFSPTRLGKREYFTGHASVGEATFNSILGGYSALSDLLAIGGIWRNPVQSFQNWQHGPVPDHENFTMNFRRFWLPMINTYAEWFSQGEYPQHQLPYRPCVTNYLFRMQLDHPGPGEIVPVSTDNEFGGSDPLHLTDHASHPFQLESSSHTRINGEGGYQVLVSESYSGWARVLLETDVRDQTLVRVDVRVHESMTALTTLGHFLLTPGYTEGRDGSGFPVAIRYVNDQDAIEYAAWRGLL